MAVYFDRYSNFRTNGEIKPIPGILIPEATTDKYAIYREGITRLDKLSQTYYNEPYSGWLILLANPQFGGLEFNIPDSTSIRIPYPLESARGRYMLEIQNYKDLYGG
jgi:hypothetical protein